MKNLIFTVVLSLFTLALTAQEKPEDIKVGTTFVLGETTSNGFMHIKLPRKNILLKRGIIAKYNILDGQKVVVAKLTSTKKGTQAKLKLANGNKFFGRWAFVTAYLESAIKAGELATNNRLAKNLLAINY